MHTEGYANFRGVARDGCSISWIVGQKIQSKGNLYEEQSGRPFVHRGMTHRSTAWRSNQSTRQRGSGAENPSCWLERPCTADSSMRRVSRSVSETSIESYFKKYQRHCAIITLYTCSCSWRSVLRSNRNVARLLGVWFPQNILRKKTTKVFTGFIRVQQPFTLFLNNCASVRYLYSISAIIASIKGLCLTASECIITV